jgi:predicted GNAT family N-acyltransferase
MEIKINTVTTDQDYRDCLYIRNKVFIEEQNINKKLEYDDKKVNAIYIVAKINLITIGTARYRSTQFGMKLERFAVLKEYRGLGVGKSLVSFLKKTLKSEKNLYLNSQKEVAGFYKKLGFKIRGDVFYEAKIPHYKMVLFS